MVQAISDTVIVEGVALNVQNRSDSPWVLSGNITAPLLIWPVMWTCHRFGENMGPSSLKSLMSMIPEKSLTSAGFSFPRGKAQPGVPPVPE